MSAHPELDDYEPHGERPLRSRVTRSVMRVVVIVGVIALVLPGLVTTMTVAGSTAQAACAMWVAYAVDGPSGAQANFEVFGPSGLGWECYSVDAFGGDRHIASLGIIPSAPRLPSGPAVNS